jgi:hypothetical protein
MCIICDTPIESLQTVTGINLMCDVLERVPVLPELRTLVCFKCPKLKAISSLPELKTLCVRKCESLRDIQSLPKIEILNLQVCPSLRKIPKMPRMQELKLVECGVEKICSQPALVTAEIISCDYIEGLPKADNLVDLNLQECVEISEIPSYPNLTRLYIFGSSVSFLPTLESLEILELESLGIHEIGAFPNLVVFKGSDLRNLVVIEDVPRLDRLFAKKCPVLIRVPNVRRAVVVDTPWVSIAQNPELEKNVKDLVKVQKQCKVALERRRRAKLVSLLKNTPLPRDICQYISNM